MHIRTCASTSCAKASATATRWRPGRWNAATGNSAGYQDWRIALNNADFAGDQIEVSIVYQTDPGTLGLGAFVDDAKITSGADTLSETSFEDGLGGWTVPGALPGSLGNTGDWTRSQSIGLVDGPGVRTGHSIMWGFGLEAVDGAESARRWERAAAAITERQNNRVCTSPARRLGGWWSASRPAARSMPARSRNRLGQECSSRRTSAARRLRSCSGAYAPRAYSSS